MGDREKKRIRVTLLLSGGHSQSIDLKPSDPLLRSLLQTIANRASGGREACAFNIALPGTKSLIFASTELVGIITDPPIVLDTGTPELATPSASAPSKWRLIENFLSAAENRALLAFAESQ